MEETYDKSYSLLDAQVYESLKELDPKSVNYKQKVVDSARLYNIKNAADKLSLENNKLEYDQENKEREADQEEKKRAFDREKLAQEKYIEDRKLDIEANKLEQEKLRMELEKTKLELEKAKIAIEERKLSLEESVKKIEQDNKKIDRIIKIAEMVINLGLNISDKIVGIKEFETMVNFETEGGFFKGWAGKLFTRERRKEKGDYR